MYSFEQTVAELTLPSFTRIEVEEQDSTRTLVLDHFPTYVLMRYSNLARRELPHSNRHGRTAVLTLPSFPSDTKSLRYILHFLASLPTELYRAPHIRSPGMFRFSEAAMIYRMSLLLELPWDQHVSRNQLLGYIASNPLRHEEFVLVWEQYPSGGEIVTSTLQAFIRHLKDKAYNWEDLRNIKGYCRERPDLLAVVDRIVKELKNVNNESGEKRCEKAVEQNNIDTAWGTRRIDQAFLRRLKRRTRGLKQK
jgi:hypothetical protein